MVLASVVESGAQDLAEIADNATDSLAGESPLLGLPEVEAPIVIAEPPTPHPRMFYDVLTKRKRRSSRIGKRRIRERFHVLPSKVAEEIPPYVPFVYWYDSKERVIRYTARDAPRTGPLLHGRYRKKERKQILEERFFYHGVAHSRWTWLGTDNILKDKRHYFKGWTRAGTQTYYDLAQTKLREVIPIQHGKREGPYYAFHENAQLAAIGNYRSDKRVGLWREFYPNGKPKRELQYPKTPNPKNKKPPFIKRDWNRKGTLLHKSS